MGANSPVWWGGTAALCVWVLLGLGGCSPWLCSEEKGNGVSWWFWCQRCPARHPPSTVTTGGLAVVVAAVLGPPVETWGSAAAAVVHKQSFSFTQLDAESWRSWQAGFPSLLLGERRRGAVLLPSPLDAGSQPACSPLSGGEWTVTHVVPSVWDNSYVLGQARNRSTYSIFLPLPMWKGAEQSSSVKAAVSPYPPPHPLCPTALQLGCEARVTLPAHGTRPADGTDGNGREWLGSEEWFSWFARKQRLEARVWKVPWRTSSG